MKDRDKVLGRLLTLADRLRGEGGCPWDRTQTLKSLQPYLIDEAYEVLAAINSLDGENLAEELGDLLFQVILLCRAAEAEKSITLEKIVRLSEEKMIRRHPHVFGEVEVDGAGEVSDNWEMIKAREKQGIPPNSLLSNPLPGLPALRRAQRIQGRVSRVGFDWEYPRAVLPRIREELEELEAELAAGDRGRLEEELGDVLFSVVNLARHLDLDAELALQRMVNRWIHRFQRMEAQAGKENKSLAAMTLEEMDRLWEEAKLSERP